MMAADPQPTPKSRRRRQTKAERDAERAAEAAKPIDPVVWMILGALILFVALWTWLDPVSFAEAGQPADQSIFQLVPLFLIRIFGKAPAVILLTILGGIPLVWGIVGWMKKCFGSTEDK